MKQTLKFAVAVKKKSDTTLNIEVGDPLDLVLQDGSVTTVTATEVSADARTISWSLNALERTAAATSSQNSTAVASDDTTGDALANALKTSYNAAQVDVAALFTANTTLGSPTSSQNGTTAASNDATRLALANALKTSYNAAQVDVAELFSVGGLGVPTSSQLETATATNDATTQTLLNDLKDAYNLLQDDIELAFGSIESGQFVPRVEDVRAVDGSHQPAAVTDTDIHDGVGADAVPRVPAVE